MAGALYVVHERVASDLMLRESFREHNV